MEIEINNCNNIENCVIVIESNTLNIKYFINRTGRTAASKAIKYVLAPDKNFMSKVEQKEDGIIYGTDPPNWKEAPNTDN